jgi:hypothetical protein
VLKPGFIASAKHERLTIAIGQPVDLVVDDLLGVVDERGGRAPGCGPLGGAALAIAAAGGVGPHLEGDPPRYAMEPAAQRILDPERCRLTRQQAKGRLERVIGVVGIAEDPPADPKDHRAMAVHQRLERQHLAPGHVTLQDLGVGQPGEGSLAEKQADLTDRRTFVHPTHTVPPRGPVVLPIVY